MKIKKYLLILLLFPIHVFAGKLQQYKCDDFSDLYECSNRCLKGENEMSYDFEIDKNNNKVIMHIFSKEKYDHSSQFVGCIVLDKKNWTCEERFKKLSFNWTYNNRMSNGKFSTWSWDNLKHEQIQSDLAFCAK